MTLLSKLAEDANQQALELHKTVQALFARTTHASSKKNPLTPTDRFQLTGKQYEIHSDGSVTFLVDVILVDDVSELPFPIREAKHDLVLSARSLKSLKNCPKRVGGDFWIGSNKGLRLEGGPEEVGGHFQAMALGLTSLADGPKTVGGNYNVYNNKLTTLEGLAELINGKLTIDITPTLPLLRIPMVKNLEDIEFGNKIAFNTNMSIFGAEKAKSASGGIVNWRPDYAYALLNILRDHLGQGRKGTLKLQNVLIDAGFEGNAKF